MGLPRPAPTQLREWQNAAITAWEANGRRGIVAAATGTGKSRVATAAAQLCNGPEWTLSVVVPRIVLLEQWLGVLQHDLSISKNSIGTIGGRNPNLEFRHRKVVAVLDSARDRLPDIANHWHHDGLKNLLIVDECHWAGTARSADLFAAHFDATLGLSATPERTDDGFEEVLIPALGDVVFRYVLRDALDDRVLAPLRLVNIYYDMDEAEANEYRRLAEQIDAAIAALRDANDDVPHATIDVEAWLGKQGATPTTKRLVVLFQQRRNLVGLSQARMGLLRELIYLGIFEDRRSLVFNETIAQAEQAFTLIQEAGIRTAVEHSKLSPDVREQAFRRFRNGSVDVLVAVRTADEGIDVPNANTAVFLSGSTGVRQRIQRIGRVTRPGGGTAVVVSLLARHTVEEQEVGRRDDLLVGADRVTHLFWSDPRTIQRLTDLLTSPD